MRVWGAGRGAVAGGSAGEGGGGGGVAGGEELRRGQGVGTGWRRFPQLLQGGERRVGAKDGLLRRGGGTRGGTQLFHNHPTPSICVALPAVHAVRECAQGFKRKRAVRFRRGRPCDSTCFSRSGEGEGVLDWPVEVCEEVCELLLLLRSISATSPSCSPSSMFPDCMLYFRRPSLVVCCMKNSCLSDFFHR